MNSAVFRMGSLAKAKYLSVNLFLSPQVFHLAAEVRIMFYE